MSLISDKRETFVIGNEVNFDSIWKARSTYLFLYQSQPKTIRIHPSKRRELEAQLDRSVSPDNIMGMKIELDPNQGADEFRVGSSVEIIKEVEDYGK